MPPVVTSTLWGVADRQRNYSEGASGDWHSLYLGLDRGRSDSSRLTGMAVSRGWGVSQGLHGELEAEVNMWYPYMRGTAGESTEIWGLAGLGVGEFAYRRFDVDEISDTGNLQASLGLLGLQREWTDWGPAQLSWVGDAGAARLEVASGASGLSALSSDINRFRFGLEASFDSAKWSGRSELTGRRDRTERMSGWGAEWTGGVSYMSGRFGASMQGRTLLSHEISGYDDWSVNASLAMAPRTDGTGLSWSLEPAYGRLDTLGGGIGPGAGIGFGRPELWGDDRMRFLEGASTRPTSAKLGGNARLSYGIELGLGDRLLRPYAAYGRASTHDKYRLGMEVEGLWQMGLEFSSEAFRSAPSRSISVPSASAVEGGRSWSLQLQLRKVLGGGYAKRRAEVRWQAVERLPLTGGEMR